MSQNAHPGLKYKFDEILNREYRRRTMQESLL